MEVRVLFFARSRELTGTSEARLTLPDGSTTAALLQQLLRQVRGEGSGMRGALPCQHARLRSAAVSVP